MVSIGAFIAIVGIAIFACPAASSLNWLGCDFKNENFDLVNPNQRFGKPGVALKFDSDEKFAEYLAELSVRYDKVADGFLRNTWTNFIQFYKDYKSANPDSTPTGQSVLSFYHSYNDQFHPQTDNSLLALQVMKMVDQVNTEKGLDVKENSCYMALVTYPACNMLVRSVADESEYKGEKLDLAEGHIAPVVKFATPTKEGYIVLDAANSVNDPFVVLATAKNHNVTGESYRNQYQLAHSIHGKRDTYILTKVKSKANETDTWKNYVLYHVACSYCGFRQDIQKPNLLDTTKFILKSHNGYDLAETYLTIRSDEANDINVQVSVYEGNKATGALEDKLKLPTLSNGETWNNVLSNRDTNSMEKFSAAFGLPANGLQTELDKIAPVIGDTAFLKAFLCASHQEADDKKKTEKFKTTSCSLVECGGSD